LVDLRRRKFLKRCCQGASAALASRRLAASVWAQPFPFAPQTSTAVGEFHLHPHYRSQRPIDAVLLKVQAGSDEFVTEQHVDKVGVVLKEWSSSLLRSPRELAVFDKSLTQDFKGTSFRPVDERSLRSGGAVEVHRRSFASAPVLEKKAFLADLRTAYDEFEKLITAEFQVTSINAQASLTSNQPLPLQTHIRYELVGMGRAFHREQRVGEWEIEWETLSADEFQVRRWHITEETRSRTRQPVYVDIADHTLGGNPSYAAQLAPGVDYWRTVLDGACGIDIYGHNGVSVADIDNDGFDDLYVCQPAGLPNRLYRNRGDGVLEDVTDASGLGILENTACALFADINNDGRQDLIVVLTSGPILFLNESEGKFRRKPDAFRFANPPEGTFTGAALADYDRDGWLDIYFCLYTYYQGTDQYKYPLPYYDAQNGPPNFLMRNQRDGTFRDVTAESGLSQNNKRYSFCCGWSDFNHDGWPDLYVVNDFGRKNLYKNNGNGTFTDIAPQAGVEDTGAGMSVCWCDFDNDGAEDLYVANMWTAAGLRISSQEIFQKDIPERDRSLYRKHAMGNSLFRNSGNGSFRNVSASAGVGMGRWSWSSDAWDFDHDGYPDLYVTNGMVSGPSREDLNSFFWRQVVANSPREARPSSEYEQGWNAVNELIRADGTWSGYERNVFYANNHDGTFSDVSGAIGLDFLEDGRSFALADFDHDGRMEVFLKNRNGPQLRILKNVLADLPPSVCFRLRGTKSNRDAIGAVITLETESLRQTRRLAAGSGFLSQHSKEIFFGLGDAKGPARVSIRWPSGLVQEVRDLPVNHRVWVEEGSNEIRTEPFRHGNAWSGQALHPEAANSQEPRVAETWLLAPVTAPAFTLSDVSGKPRSFSALRGKPVLLNLSASKSEDCVRQLEQFADAQEPFARQGLELVVIDVEDAGDSENLEALAARRKFAFPILRGSADLAGIYNILYRYLFDRHRDLLLPTSFLINANGEIVKVYQGIVPSDRIAHDVGQIPRTQAERLARALPFPGVSDAFASSRNYLSLGSVFYQRGYLEQAQVSFQQALRDDPNSAEALYGLGSVFLQQEKRDEARESFQRAINLHSSYPGTLPNAWNNLGLLATRDGKYGEAIQNFQQALALNPDFLVALTNLGNAYRQQKRWDEAQKTLEHAVSVAPADPEANYSLGMVFAALSDTERAQSFLQKALNLRPVYPEALNNLGVLYLRTQRRDQAVASFEECIRVAPAFDQSYLNLARVYALENTPVKARTVLLELLKQHPDHPQAQRALADLPQ
jgi:tetratricopeptide (TPR) repeat protein